MSLRNHIKIIGEISKSQNNQVSKVPAGKCLVVECPRLKVLQQEVKPRLLEFFLQLITADTQKCTELTTTLRCVHV